MPSAIIILLLDRRRLCEQFQRTAWHWKCIEPRSLHLRCQRSLSGGSTWRSTRTTRRYRYTDWLITASVIIDVRRWLQAVIDFSAGVVFEDGKCQIAIGFIVWRVFMWASAVGTPLRVRCIDRLHPERSRLRAGCPIEMTAPCTRPTAANKTSRGDYILFRPVYAGPPRLCRWSSIIAHVFHLRLYAMQSNKTLPPSWATKV